MKVFAIIYHIFYSPLFLLFRILLILVFIISSVFSLMNNVSYSFFIGMASLLLILEIFLYGKITKTRPQVALQDNKNEPLDSFYIDALAIFTTRNKTEEIVRELVKKYRVRFILRKANLLQNEIKTLSVSREDLLEKTIEIVKKISGTYIRTSDIFIAYLLLSEEVTKLLLTKDLKEDDLLNILIWERLIYPDTHEKDHYFGRGVAEDWIYGWMTETKKYMLDLTSLVLSKKRFFYPRDKEYKSLLDNLSAFKSIILVGDAGSGKNALIEQFTKDSFEGRLTNGLNHLKVFQFLVDQFLAGTQNQGELQDRFAQVVSEVSHSKDVVIVIENIETILGSSDFNLDLSSALIPYMSSSQIRLIGTTSPSSFKKFVEVKPPFQDAISIIKVDDPDGSDSLLILFEKSFEIEEKYGINITYGAVKEAIIFGPKYLPTISMPGSAVSLIEDACNSKLRTETKNLTKEDIDTSVEQKTNLPISIPDNVERKILLNLEEEIHKNIIGQDEAVTAISDALRRIRSGVNQQTKPTSFLFLGPTGVGKTQAAKVLANIYFEGEKEIIRLDMSEYSTEDSVGRILKADSGSFLEIVFNNPFSLILLDEFEKANPKIHNLFLQVFDDGRITDSNGRLISFKNSLIIATSNAGSEFIRQNLKSDNKLPEAFDKTLINQLLSQNIFSPELINRFDQVVVFKPLSQEEVREVSVLMMNDFVKSMAKQDIFISFDQTLIDKISTDGFDREFGARPLNRFLQSFIEDEVAQAILKGEIKRGDKINLSVDSLGNLQVKKV